MSVYRLANSPFPPIIQQSVTLHFLADLNDIPAEADDEREEEEEEEGGDASLQESLWDSKTEEQVVSEEKSKHSKEVDVNATTTTNAQEEMSNKHTTDGSANGVVESQESSGTEEISMDTQTTPAGDISMDTQTTPAGEISMDTQTTPAGESTPSAQTKQSDPLQDNQQSAIHQS